MFYWRLGTRYNWRYNTTQAVSLKCHLIPWSLGCTGAMIRLQCSLAWKGFKGEGNLEGPKGPAYLQLLFHCHQWGSLPSRFGGDFSVGKGGHLFVTNFQTATGWNSQMQHSEEQNFSFDFTFLCSWNERNHSFRTRSWNIGWGHSSSWTPISIW